MSVVLNEKALKAALRDAIRDVLNEEKELFSEVVRGALEDFALSRAIDEGKKSGKAEPRTVRKLLHAR